MPLRAPKASIQLSVGAINPPGPRRCQATKGNWRYLRGMSVQDIAPDAPPRPPSLPDAAAWNAQTGEWEVAPVDGAGRRDGLVRGWRIDGSLASETTFLAGERD